jgi:hypothetical protein
MIWASRVQRAVQSPEIVLPEKLDYLLPPTQFDTDISRTAFFWRLKIADGIKTSQVLTCRFFMEKLQMYRA